MNISIHKNPNKHTYRHMHAVMHLTIKLPCANVLLNIATSHTETYIITVRLILYKTMNSKKNCRSKERGKRRRRDIEPPDVAS